jgi:hypothetical protein
VPFLTLPARAAQHWPRSGREAKRKNIRAPLRVIEKGVVMSPVEELRRLVSTIAFPARRIRDHVVDLENRRRL